MPLFIEKPRRRNGMNICFYIAAVIEGRIDGASIIVEGPKEFKESDENSSILDRKFFQQVSEKAGPPRIPSVSEHRHDCIKWRKKIIRQYAV